MATYFGISVNERSATRNQAMQETVAINRIAITFSSRNGIPRNVDIVRILFIDKSNVTRQMAALEEAGLVTRCPDEEDRRQVRVFPTEKALALLPEIRAGFREWREYLQEGLTEEELELFCGVMDKVTRRAAAWCGRMVTQGEEEP